MALTVHVEFLLDHFAGSDGHDGTPPEWPPAPARVFSALVAGCHAEYAEALEWLERQGSPLIHASDSSLSAPHGRWLVTNAIDPTKFARYPCRTNVQRARQRRWLVASQVRYEWPDATPSAEVVRALDDAARRVPYIGRPTSPAAVRVTAEPAVTDGTLRTYEPAHAHGRSFEEVRLRVPYPGYLSALEEAFAADTRADPVVYDRYVVRGEAEPVPAKTTASLWAHFLVFRLVTSAYLAGERTLQVTSAFRDALIARIGTDVPPVVSGHGAEPPHCAFLGLPHVGHEHADGHILGIALAVPAAEPAVVAAVRDALRLDEGLGIELRNVPGFGCLRFERQLPSSSAPWALQATRWTRPSSTWRTVLPAVLDRAPSRRLAEHEAVEQTVRNAGLPEPVEFRISRTPLLKGDIGLRPSQTKRDPQERTRPFRHLWLKFADEVAGPVVIGAKRHFGLGLCVPWEPGEQADDVA